MALVYLCVRMILITNSKYVPRQYFFSFGMFISFLVMQTSIAASDLSVKPKIVMLEVKEAAQPLPHSTDVLVPIRAQLSTLPMKVETQRVYLQTMERSIFRKAAGRIAVQNHADIVFWIEETNTVYLHFFKPNTATEKRITRKLQIQSQQQSNRFETIAIAVAGTIEGLLEDATTEQKDKNMARTTTESAASSNDTPTPLQGKRRALVEASAGYTGVLFSNQTIANGITLGLGIFPKKALHLSLAVSQFIPFEHQNEGVRLSFQSRTLEMAMVSGFVVNNFSLRGGIIGTMEFRHFSAVPLSSDTETMPDGFKLVYSLGPTIRAIWFFHRNIGLHTAISTLFALNDTVYKIEYGTHAIEVLSPNNIKLLWQIGFLAKL